MSYQPGLVPFDLEAIRVFLQDELVNIAAELNEARSGNVTEVAGVQIHYGSGTPEGAVTAEAGSLFLRTDGGASTSLYVKESGSGNTGWIAK